jgi:probable phosphoglycerate mutase
LRPPAVETPGEGNGRVLLVRHGPVTAAWRGRLYGHSEAEPEPLAGDLRWRGPPPDAVVCSDLKRAVYAAGALFPGVPLTLEPGLRETDYGRLDGRDLLALHEEDPTLWDRWLADPGGTRFPGGETFDEVMGRTVAAVERARLLAPDGCVAVVTHGGVIRSYVAWVLGASAHGVGRLRVSTLHCVEVRYWDAVPVIERVNFPAS